MANLEDLNLTEDCDCSVNAFPVEDPTVDTVEQHESSSSSESEQEISNPTIAPTPPKAPTPPPPPSSSSSEEEIVTEVPVMEIDAVHVKSTPRKSSRYKFI